jgi:phosphatidylglycerophosphate synthase
LATIDTIRSSSAQALPRSVDLSNSLASVETGLTALTVGRLLFVPVIIASFTVSALVTTLALVLFIAADVYDGVVARRLNADGPGRRALDSIVDRLAIDACLIGAYFSRAMPLPILCVLLARDAYLALLCQRMMSQRQVAIKADWLYRSLNLAVAAWAIMSPFVSANLRVGLALLLLVFSLVVACDLARGVRTVLNSPPRLRDVVIDAGWLRRNAALAGLEIRRSGPLS